MIDDHHQKQEFECGFVLAVDGGVHGDVRVEVLQTGLHPDHRSFHLLAAAHLSMHSARRRNAN